MIKPVIKVSESQECVVLVEWCRWQSLPIIKITNEGKRSWFNGKLLKKEGLSPGVPDYFLPIMKNSFGGLFIEMKSKKGKPTEEQLSWIELLKKQGYCAVIAFGFEEARDIIMNYLKEKNKHV